VTLESVIAEKVGFGSEAVRSSPTEAATASQEEIAPTVYH